MNKSVKITVGKLAAILGISRQAIYKRLRRHDHDLPFRLSKKHPGPGIMHKGARYFFDADAVALWAAAYKKKWKS